MQCCGVPVCASGMTSMLATLLELVLRVCVCVCVVCCACCMHVRMLKCMQKFREIKTSVAMAGAGAHGLESGLPGGEGDAEGVGGRKCGKKSNSEILGGNLMRPSHSQPLAYPPPPLTACSCASSSPPEPQSARASTDAWRLLHATNACNAGAVRAYVCLCVCEDERKEKMCLPTPALQYLVEVASLRNGQGAP